MELTVDVALAAPVWQAYTYAVPKELAPLVRPLGRLAVPLRGRTKLGFALGEPRPGSQKGLKAVRDVLEDLGRAQAWPPELLGFFQRAAAHYQAPLGQVLAWCLPAGMGSLKPGSAAAPKQRTLAVAAWRSGQDARLPGPETQAAQLLRRLQTMGPTPIPELRTKFKRAAALCKDLESRGWLTISHRPLVKDLLGDPLWPEPKPESLTGDQQKALARLAPALDSGEFKPFLLHGVTGSGKTELYLALCEKALAAGRSALIMAPEIGLCLRLEGLLAARFGQDQVAVLHSGLSPAARRGQWEAIASGRAKVVAGARSAVFAPLKNPGLICVDEEQDEAYKQEDRLRYHGRDLALLRGKEQGLTVVLGTATPAVTTYHRAKGGGQLKYLSLPRRVKDAHMPKMEVVDLRSQGKLKGGFMSKRLHQALIETVAQGRQAALFLNRRGYSPAYICTACGQSVGCPACSLSLTWHQASRRLVCHTCGHQRPKPKACPSCGAEAGAMKPLGLGTEAVAERLAELEPGLRLARLDRDTASNPKKLAALLRQVADREVDVLIGTQMITKGHHFPGLGLVGVLLADQALAMADFRSAERAFVLLTQVAGRAGREGPEGLVIVQAYDPEHHAVRAALTSDPASFYAEELDQRQALSYPPFARLISLRIEAASNELAARAAGLVKSALEQARQKLGLAARILGPAPAPVAKVQSRHRHLILIKAPSAGAAGRVLAMGRHLLGPLPGGARLLVDVDPLTLS